MVEGEEVKRGDEKKKRERGREEKAKWRRLEEEKKRLADGG